MPEPWGMPGVVGDAASPSMVLSLSMVLRSSNSSSSTLAGLLTTVAGSLGAVLRSASTVPLSTGLVAPGRAGSAAAGPAV